MTEASAGECGFAVWPRLRSGLGTLRAGDGLRAELALAASGTVLFCGQVSSDQARSLLAPPRGDELSPWRPPES